MFIAMPVSILITNNFVLFVNLSLIESTSIPSFSHPLITGSKSSASPSQIESTKNPAACHPQTHPNSKETVPNRRLTETQCAAVICTILTQ